MKRTTAPITSLRAVVFAVLLLVAPGAWAAESKVQADTGSQVVKEELAPIGHAPHMPGNATHRPSNQHSAHPDAQWFPGAGMGLPLHCDHAAARAIGISWVMIPGRPPGKKEITEPEELARIVRAGDDNLDRRN